MYERNVTQIEALVRKQNEWRAGTLNLIASENVLSERARAVMGSDFAHRYAEGHPGERYYQGTEIIDEVEARIKKHLKIYPLARKNSPPATEFTNMSGLAEYQTIMPNDFGFFESLKKRYSFILNFSNSGLKKRRFRFKKPEFLPFARIFIFDG